MERNKEAFGRDGHVLDCDNDFMGVCLCQTGKIVFFKYMQFIKCQSYLNKAIFKIIFKPAEQTCLSLGACGEQQRAW